MSDTKVTSEFKETFVDMLGNIPNITAVCKLLNVNPETVRKHRKRDEEWNTQILGAIECGYDMMEEEARRRKVQCGLGFTTMYLA